MRRDTPWTAIGMSRATWYRHGKPATKPDRPKTNAEIARSISVSLRTLYRARKEFKDNRIARLREYQLPLVRKLLEERPGISDEQINDMWKAHLDSLSDGQLAKIVGEDAGPEQ
jgi:hypothetical protein